MAGPLERYRALIDADALEIDPAQEAAIERLDALASSLQDGRPALVRFFSRSKQRPKGAYLWGGVGRGKTLLMDLFFNNVRFAPRRRVHFHEFMAETHDRIAAWRALDERSKRRHRGASRSSLDDPVPPVAKDIAQDAMLLCFDEFHVTDIADAMLLGRLFDALHENGVVIVATSNRHPDDLYRDGINRQLFLPFIAALKERMDVMELVAARDYRLARLAGAPVYYAPLDDAALAAMERAWDRFISGARVHSETVEVKGRKITVRRAARGAARFGFEELCARPLGASDYMALVHRYGTLFIDNIPRMGPDRRNEAKRFVTLVDTLYDAGAKLVCSADTEPHGLYPEGDGSFEFERTASRLMEMRSQAYLAAARRDAAAE